MVSSFIAQFAMTSSATRRTLCSLCVVLGLVLVVSSQAVKAQTIIVTVTTMDDDAEMNGNCTLREAVRAVETRRGVDACTLENSAIFQKDVVDLRRLQGVLTLTQGEIEIEESMLIQGPGAETLLLSGNASSDIFVIKGVVGFETIGGIRQPRRVSVHDLTFIQALTPIVIFNSRVTIVDSVIGSSFAKNKTGISMANGELEVKRCLIHHNERRGLVFTSDGDFTIEGTTITRNEVPPTLGSGTRAAGAGIYIQGADGDILNSTISGNIGGGVWGDVGGRVRIANSTVYDNIARQVGEATVQGGVDGVFASRVTLFSSIVAANEGFDIAGEVESDGYNLIGVGNPDVFTPNTGDQVGTSEAPLDPMVGPLAANGGLTQTHALMATSPAIDQGSCPSIVRDQRGYLNPATGRRAFDIAGIENVDDGCDIGAVEYNAVGVATETPQEGPDRLVPEFVLSPAYPNPSAGRASFTLKVAVTQQVEIAVFDVLGRQVAVLSKGQLQAGTVYDFTIPAATLSQGLYFYRATGETFSATGNVVLGR